VDAAQSLWDLARETWRALFPVQWHADLARAFIMFSFAYTVVLAIELACGTRTRNYQTRDFAHDVAFNLYYRTGIHRLMLSAPLLLALDVPLSFLDLRLLSGLPAFVQVVAGLVIGDFIMYWLHRAQHAVPFLWAFHTTHHSTEHLTFAAYQRFHPLEVLVGDLLGFLILRILGFEIYTWAAVYLIANFIGELQHSQIPWRLGPFYRVIVTPSFHAHHHSADRLVHDRNYGGLFAFWDYLFGTAVDDHAPAPVKYGLDDVKARSLWSTLVDPFRLLVQFYGPRDRRPPALIDAEDLARDDAAR
jgi:sterol desaturase/sphingolipid hydroxylase (fatty acid hydroxylase superfamily)